MYSDTKIKKYFPFVFCFEGREYSGKEEEYIKHIIQRWHPELNFIYEQIKSDLAKTYPELVDTLHPYPWDGKEDTKQ